MIKGMYDSLATLFRNATIFKVPEGIGVCCLFDTELTLFFLPKSYLDGKTRTVYTAKRSNVTGMKGETKCKQKTRI